MKEILQFDSRLKDTLKRYGIGVAVFDLDGTLLNADDPFSKGIRRSCIILTNGDHIATRALEGKTYDTITELKEIYHVDPSIMINVTRLMAKIIGVPDEDPRLDRALAEVEQIYTTYKYPIFPGAIATVNDFNKAGVATVIGTHRKRGYLDNTLRTASELYGIFSMPPICFPTEVSKADSWERELTRAGININEAMVIEDNKKDGIDPVLDLGVPMACWINKKLDGDPYMESERLLVVRTIDQVIPAFLEKTASS